MLDFEATQGRLLAHWLKYMQAHPEYIADAIERHFLKSPQDKATMKPQLAAEWIRITQLKKLDTP